MRRFRKALATVGLCALLASCQAGGGPDPWMSIYEETGQADIPLVTATFYPLYDMVNKVFGNTYAGGEFVAPGLGQTIDFCGESDPHEFDPSDPQKLAAASESYLLVSLMDGFDSFADAVADKGMKHVRAGEVSGLTDLDGRPIDGSQGHIDPHVWLSPKRAVALFDAVSQAVIENYPDQTKVGQLEANAVAQHAALVNLDQTYAETLAPFAGQLLVTSHEAFSYLCLDYGLEQFGIADFADNTPSPDRLAQMEDLIVDNDIHCIYVESLDSHTAVDVVIEDIGLSHRGYRLEKRELSALESLPYKQLMAGEDYISVMMDNLYEIAEGLGGQIL